MPAAIPERSSRAVASASASRTQASNCSSSPPKKQSARELELQRRRVGRAAVGERLERRPDLRRPLAAVPAAELVDPRRRGDHPPAQRRLVLRQQREHLVDRGDALAEVAGGGERPRHRHEEREPAPVVPLREQPDRGREPVRGRRRGAGGDLDRRSSSAARSPPRRRAPRSARRGGRARRSRRRGGRAPRRRARGRRAASRPALRRRRHGGRSDGETGTAAARRTSARGHARAGRRGRRAPRRDRGRRRRRRGRGRSPRRSPRRLWPARPHRARGGRSRARSRRSPPPARRRSSRRRRRSARPTAAAARPRRALVELADELLEVERVAAAVAVERAATARRRRRRRSAREPRTRSAGPARSARRSVRRRSRRARWRAGPASARVRTAPASTTGRRAGWRTRWESSSTDASSAQWRSSRTSSSGRLRREPPEQRADGGVRAVALLLRAGRRVAAEPGERREDPRELGTAVGVGRLDHALVQRPEVVVERVEEDGERHVSLELGRPSLEHEHLPLVGGPGELAEDRRLADPRLALDEEQVVVAAAARAPPAPRRAARSRPIRPGAPPRALNRRCSSNRVFPPIPLASDCTRSFSSR